MLIRNVMQVSLHYEGQVVDQGAPKTEGATPIFETEIWLEGAGAVYSYSKAKCWIVWIKRGVRLIIRRTETRWGTVGGGGAFIDGGREGKTHQRQQVWEPLRRPVVTLNDGYCGEIILREIMTGSLRVDV